MKKNINQNSFLITCVCCIVLLLTLCYFGINSNLKGTAATDTDTSSCPSGYTDSIVEDNDVTYCSNGRLTYDESAKLICSYTSSTLVNEEGYTCTEYSNEDGSYYNCIAEDISYCAVDASKVVEIPTSANYCNTGVAYNGSSQTLTKLAGTGYTFSNNTGTNAGTYEVTASLLDGYIWNDSSTDDITFNCTIKKAVPSLYVSASTLSIKENGTGTFNVGCSEDGYVGIEISDASVVSIKDAIEKDGMETLSVEKLIQKSVTVTGVSAGTSSLSIIFIPDDTNNFESSSWDVVKVTVTGSTITAITPTAEEYCKTGLVYNGSSQTLTKTAGEGYTFSNNTKTNAGTYDVIATLSAGYAWSDGDTGTTKKFSCSIEKATPKITLSSSSLSVEKGSTNTFTIQGSVIGDFEITSGTLSKVSITQTIYNDIVANTEQSVTVTGVTVGSSTLIVEFTPNDTDNYNNAVSKNVTVTVTEPEITTKTAIIPTTEEYCKTGLVYNGSSQTLTKTAGEGYTFSNNTKTNAGTYDVIATLSSGYAWSDDETGTKTISCSIAKANSVLTMPENSIDLSLGATTTIEYEYNGDGNLYCSSENTSIAACEVLNGGLNVISKAPGTTVIVLNAEESTNYKSALTQLSVEVTESTSDEDETSKEQTFTVTFDANGGKLDESNNKSCTTSSTSCVITDLPTATRDGYTFKGWATGSTCDSVETEEITLEFDDTYYACWYENEVIDTPSVDEDGNINEGDAPQTGDIVIALVCFLGLFAIGYASYYFKSVKSK